MCGQKSHLNNVATVIGPKGVPYISAGHVQSLSATRGQYKPICYLNNAQNLEQIKDSYTYKYSYMQMRHPTPLADPIK